MAVFASLVAPFGGFFASGFKRAFKIKVCPFLCGAGRSMGTSRHAVWVWAQDFGDSIPGHGGFTDRMDCQIIMGLFVYVYFSQVIYFGGYEVDTVVAKIAALTHEDQVSKCAGYEPYGCSQRNGVMTGAQMRVLTQLAAKLGKTVM